MGNIYCNEDNDEDEEKKFRNLEKQNQIVVQLNGINKLPYKIIPSNQKNNISNNNYDTNFNSQNDFINNSMNIKDQNEQKNLEKKNNSSENFMTFKNNNMSDGKILTDSNSSKLFPLLQPIPSTYSFTDNNIP